MIKLLSVVALTAASILPINAAKAQSNWEYFIAQRTCVHLRNGASAYDAGYRAGMDALGTRYESAFLLATQRYSSDELGLLLVDDLIELCPAALLRAS
jgi:hypothetical protein